MTGGPGIFTSDNTKEIDAAIFRAKPHFKRMRRNRKNPHFNSRYIDLDALLDAVAPALRNEGVDIRFGPAMTVNGDTLVECRLLHVATGEFVAVAPSAGGKDKSAQTVGSIITYLRRYGLGAILGVTTDDDDDAESAMPRGTAQSVASRVPPALPVRPPAQRPPQGTTRPGTFIEPHGGKP